MRILVIVTLVGLVLGGTVVAETLMQVNSPIPELQLPTLDGKIVKLSDFLGKKKVIVTFFTSWSKSCQKELQELQTIYSENDDMLAVLAVSFDKKLKELKNYLVSSGLTFPILHDKKLSYIDTFQILIIPTTFCVNKEGVIEKIFVDYDENIKEAIEEWLKS